MINEFGEILTDEGDTEILPENPGETTDPDIPEDPEPVEPDPEEPPENPPDELEDSEDIKALKLRLREADYPLFSNEELQYLLDSCGGSLDMATYRAAILKSEANGLTLNGVEIASMSSYFLRIAGMYRPSNSGVLKGL